VDIYLLTQKLEPLDDLQLQDMHDMLTRIVLAGRGCLSISKGYLFVHRVAHVGKK
jgi:hypothetical protein